MRSRSITTVPAQSTLECDVCIVGSGPAGLTLAHELDGTGARVVLLESGSRVRSDFADALNDLDNVGAPRTPDQWEVRNRILGGTSHTWSGRLATFDDVDFAERDWVPDSGWPVARSDVAAYFVRSLPYFGAERADVADNNGVRVRQALDAGWPGVDRSVFRPYGWRYSRDPVQDGATRFGPRALAADLPDVQCLLDATVTHVDTEPGSGRVERVEVTTSGGVRRWVRAPRVVLCTGAIENARLLLASRRVEPDGLGNRHDLVGRYLMDHLRGTVGTYRAEDHLAAQRLFADVHLTRGGSITTLVSGVALTPEVQASERLLNAVLFVHIGDIADDDPVRALRDLARLRDPRRSLARVYRHRDLVLNDLASRARSRPAPGIRTRTGITLQCMTEQQPDRDRRVRLSTRCDAFGTPLPVVDWRISEAEERTVRFATARFLEQMNRLELPVPDPDPMIADPDAPLVMPDVAHPTGTTRMAADPRHGVVDVNCAVFGTEGLFVAGSSVFPTSGHANPTQTIVALAVRLADHLKAQLRGTR